MKKNFEYTNIKSKEELTRLYSSLLKKYDFYFISHPKYIKNSNYMDLFYLEDEKIFCVITGKEIGRVVNKKNNKFLFADKPE